MCTDIFYGDDETGKSVHGITYEEIKSNKTYKELLLLGSDDFDKKSLSQLIPLWWDNKLK
jgi:hypothetical protein